MRAILAGVFSTAVLLLLVSCASAETIYFDDFSGSSGTDLNGLAPDVGTNNWVACDMFTADGMGEGYRGSATLAFTPETGKIYNLSADLNGINTTNGGSNWIALGFASGQSTAVGSNYAFYRTSGAGGLVIGQTWFLRRDQVGLDSYDDQSFRGPGTGGAENIASTVKQAGAVPMAVELDTRPAQWVATYFYNGSQVRQYTYPTPPTITSVGVALLVDSSANVATGSVDNFKLTVDIPEPSSLVLLALAGLGLLAVRRRR